MDNQFDKRPELVQVSDWHPQGVLKTLAASSRNFVGLLEDECSVLKYPQQKTQDAIDALHEEAARFEALGPHQNLVFFKGVHKDGLIFEFCEKGQLEDVLQSQLPLTSDNKKNIAKQITLCLRHLHEKHFIHCDLNVNNVFITAALVAKVGDIQGQLYNPDGTVELPTMSQENAKSRHPQAEDDEFSPRTDIFALGTLLFQLCYGHPPFPDLDEYRDAETVQARYRDGDFPLCASSATGMDKIICKCWNSGYENALEILRDLDDIGTEAS
ncbi:hypothetical protein LTR86_011058 [Recurvomyces mirabilis]|nr:hypothetical protein LTR86_011058 [Recurvomyces mirabilis]